MKDSYADTGHMQSTWQLSTSLANGPEPSEDGHSLDGARANYGTNVAPQPQSEVEQPGNAVAIFKLELGMGLGHSDVLFANLDLLHSALQARQG
jgi:hypothetical protein